MVQRAHKSGIVSWSEHTVADATPANKIAEVVVFMIKSCADLSPIVIGSRYLMYYSMKRQYMDDLKKNKQKTKDLLELLVMENESRD